ncbi:Addiction module toxin RelE [Gammaproteobacteria bacterium]
MGTDTWTVIFTDEAERELRDLPLDMQTKYLRIAWLLQAFGPQQVREPYVKHLEGQLWEMRLQGRDGIARVLYFAQIGRRLCLVRVFVKKTEKTPRSEITLALHRIAEITSREDTE